MAEATPHPPRDPPSPTLSQLPPVPASPTYSYASTANPLSQYNLPLPPPPRPPHAVLTKADLDQSQHAYTDLLSSAKAYRVALASLSSAASSFGSALESCARLKESRADALGPPAAASLSRSFTAENSCTADMLLATAGVHHLVANHQQILSETVYRSFEVPLLHELDKWRREIDDETESYARTVREQSREIQRLEKEGLKLHRQRRRDVAKFRSHLVQLTTKLDGLTALHADHARTLLRESQETSTKIVDAACSLVRAEVDIFEGLARKGWTGGGLDSVLERGADLFAADDAGDVDAGSSNLFSILPPKSILADNASDTGRPTAGHARADSLLVDTDRYQSLAGAVSPVKGSGDADSVFSDVIRPRGGGARPFSPLPVRVDPDEVMMGPRLLRAANRESSTAAVFGSDNEAGHDDHDDDEEDEDGVGSRRERDRDLDATPRPSGFKMLRRALDEEEGEHPWRDEGGGGGSGGGIQAPGSDDETGT